MFGDESKRLHSRKYKTIDELALYLGNRSEGQSNFSLLLGAGASFTSGIHTGRDLVENWRKDYYYKLSNNSEGDYDESEAIKWLSANCADWYDPEKEYASFFGYIYGTASQRRIFVERQVQDAKPSIGYYFLSRLVNKKYINTVFTTNFDDLINEALYRFGTTRPIVCAHDSSVEGILLTSQRPKIIKLHGDYLFDDIKCTIGGTAELDKNMDEKFRQFLREYGLIVMGYSGEDDSIMDPLTNLLEDPSYMRNGLYWCVRKGGYISPKLAELLKHDRVFVVLIDGFDGALAKISDELKISPDLAPEFQNTSGAGGLVSHWLSNREVYKDENKIIESQLSRLEASQNKNELARALGDLYEDDKDIKGAADEFDDRQVADLIHLKKLSNQKKYIEAIEYSNKSYKENISQGFQVSLFLSDYNCWRKLRKNNNARDVCIKLQNIDPTSPYHILREFDVEHNYTKKLRLIDKSLEKDKYLWAPYHKKACYLIDCIKHGTEKISEKIFEEVSANLQKSLTYRPELKSPSWATLIKFMINNVKLFRLDEEIIKLINEARKQDPYSPVILEMIFYFCQEKKCSKAFGESIFDLVNKALTEYFPNNSPDLLRVAVDASIEFDYKDFALEISDEIENNAKSSDELYKHDEYVISKSDMFLDIHQDLDESILYMEEAIEINPSPTLYSNLFNLYLYNDDLKSAEQCLPRARKMFNEKFCADMEIRFYNCSGEFRKSIEVADSFKAIEFYDHKYAIKKIYTYLIAKDYEKAKQVGSDILDKYGWDIEAFSELIINYEFACGKLDKANKKRLSNLVAKSSRKQVIAMANLLLENEEEGINLMKEAVRKKYSWKYEYKEWPIAKEFLPRLLRELGAASEKLKAV